MKKLQNKQTGEIGCLVCSFEKTPEKLTVVECIDERRGSKVWYYDTLAELNDDWEDYEEPEKTIEITPPLTKDDTTVLIDFPTHEEAKEATEKLKAWKRLKDKGFKFTDWNCPCRELEFIVDEDKFFKASGEVNEETRADLDLLFGGEECHQ